MLALVRIALAAPASSSSEVVYDQNTSTIGNVSFLVKGIYGVSKEDFKQVAGYGFNVVQNYGFSAWSDEEVADYLNEARKHGLKVLFHLGVNKPTPDVLIVVNRRIGKFKDHPALYAWYLADEPSVAKCEPEELVAVYRSIKKADPAHPVFSSNWELDKFKDACDADMPQYYFGPPSLQRKGPLRKQLDPSRKNPKPWIAIVNTHDAREFATATPDTHCLSPAYLLEGEGTSKLSAEEAAKRRDEIKVIRNNLTNPPFKPLPTYPDTPEKVRSQALDMFTHGSNGIFYWLYQPESSLNERWGYYTIFVRPKLRDSLKTTLGELDALWPRIQAPATNSTTWYDAGQGHVFCWFRREARRMTLILVNESTVAHETNIPIPGLDRYPVLTASVSGEKRSLKIQNGALKDKFADNEAHVYLIDAP